MPNIRANKYLEPRVLKRRQIEVDLEQRPKRVLLQQHVLSKRDVQPVEQYPGRDPVVRQRLVSSSEEVIRRHEPLDLQRSRRLAKRDLPTDARGQASVWVH